MLRLAAIQRNVVYSRPILWLWRLLRRPEPQDIMKIGRYRPELYGDPLHALKREVFSTSSWWSIEDQELFAALVARLRQCEICTVLHAAQASGTTQGRRDEVAAALADWRSASLRPELAAACRALEALVLDTASFGSKDLEELRALGVPPSAMEDLLYISTVLSIMSRVASALGAELDSNYADVVRQFGRAIAAD